MIYDLLIVAIYTACMIFGVHAVTRPGKLLSFLGVYIKEQYEFASIQPEIDELLADLQYDLLASIEAQDFESHEQLLNDYYKAHYSLLESNNRYEELQYIIEKKQSKLWWKVISKFAPMLTECLTCMSSFWSIFVLTQYYFDLQVFGIPTLLFFFPIAVAGFIEIVFKIACLSIQQINQ